MAARASLLFVLAAFLFFSGCVGGNDFGGDGGITGEIPGTDAYSTPTPSNAADVTPTPVAPSAGETTATPTSSTAGTPSPALPSPILPSPTPTETPTPAGTPSAPAETAEPGQTQNQSQSGGSAPENSPRVLGEYVQMPGKDNETLDVCVPQKENEIRISRRIRNYAQEYAGGTQKITRHFSEVSLGIENVGREKALNIAIVERMPLGNILSISPSPEPSSTRDNTVWLVKILESGEEKTFVYVVESKVTQSDYDNAALVSAESRREGQQPDYSRVYLIIALELAVGIAVFLKRKFLR